MRLTIARVLAGIVALMFIGNGLLYMFAPEMQLASTMIEPTGDGIFGTSNVRANIGAPMVTFGILMIMGIVKMAKVPLRVVMIFLVLAIIGRIAGIISMGIDPEFFSVRIIVVLSIFFAVNLFAHQTFDDTYGS